METMNTMRHDPVIEQRVDYMARVSESWNRKYICAREAGQDLARAVQVYLDDPQAAGTRSLADAREHFMRLSSGNFTTSA